MFPLILLLAILMTAVVPHQSAAAGDSAGDPKIGVLLVNHGSRSET